MIAAKNNYGIVLQYIVFISYIWKKTIRRNTSAKV